MVNGRGSGVSITVSVTMVVGNVAAALVVMMPKVARMERIVSFILTGILLCSRMFDRWSEASTKNSVSNTRTGMMLFMLFSLV